MRKVMLLLVLLVGVLACRTQVVLKSGNFHFAVGTSLADVRNSEAQIDTGMTKSEGIQVYMDKQPSSPQFMGMVEKVAPDLMNLLGLAVATKGASSVASTLADLVDDDPLGLFKDDKEDSKEDEKSLVEEKVAPKKRRTPEEKAAAMEARGKR